MRTKTKTQFVIGAMYLYDYLIEVTFEDHTTRVLDLERLFTQSDVLCFRKFESPEKFRQFRVEDGTLAWGDDECDISPFRIYEGAYDAVLEHA